LSAIDKDILKLFNSLTPSRQGQLLDVLGRLVEDQRAQQEQGKAEAKDAKKPVNH
jgi:hypothetical protein